MNKNIINTIIEVNDLFSGNVIFVGGVSLFYLGKRTKVGDIDIVVKHKDLKYLDTLDGVKYFINYSNIRTEGVHRGYVFINGIYIDVFIKDDEVDYDEIEIKDCKIKIASLKQSIKHYNIIENIRINKNLISDKYKDILKELIN